MAKSRFEYVRSYELPDTLLPGTYIVARIDGRGFHKFSDAHGFDKPNDVRALDLMNHAARCVMDDLKDVVCAFGESDEYSFLIRKSSKLYNRRRSKINSTIVSIFTASYVFHWPRFFPNSPLTYPPSFDGRIVLYPSPKEVRDYFSWRQADTHINNLYNTAFWALIKDGKSTSEANKALQGTDSKDKNELLFSKYNVNYNNLPAIFRKGTVLVRRHPAPIGSDSVSQDNAEGKIGESDVGAKPRAKRKDVYEGITGDIEALHEDIIGDTFWDARPWLLNA